MCIPIFKNIVEMSVLNHSHGGVAKLLQQERVVIISVTPRKRSLLDWRADKRVAAAFVRSFAMAQISRATRLASGQMT